MPETVINGARLAWQQMGDGPDVLLVHGLAASRAFWFAPYAMTLKSRFRVTLFDLRGHGYSERTSSGYSATAMAADIAGLLDHLEIDSTHVVGHSYGGGAALEFAVAHPDRVRRLAIFDTRVHRLQPFQRLHDSPYLSPLEQAIAGHIDHDWANEPQIGFKFLEAAARWRLQREADAEAGALPSTEGFVPFGEGRGNGRVARQWLGLIDETEAAQEFLVPGASADAITNGLRMPLWLVYGERSRCLPSQQALHLLLPEAQTTVIEGAGHFFPVSHADMLLPLLHDFLCETSERSASAASISARTTTPPLVG